MNSFYSPHNKNLKKLNQNHKLAARLNKREWNWEILAVSVALTLGLGPYALLSAFNTLDIQIKSYVTFTLPHSTYSFDIQEPFTSIRSPASISFDKLK